MSELVEKVRQAVRPHLYSEGGNSEVVARAAIAAVVRALRDEYTVRGYGATGTMSWCAFNEILGPAGDEVAEPTVGQRLIKAAHEAAAIARGEATAPAVCEWTCVAEGAEYDIYDVGCDSESLSAWRRPEHCPSCGKPIKFTEAQR